MVVDVVAPPSLQQGLSLQLAQVQQRGSQLSQACQIQQP